MTTSGPRISITPVCLGLALWCALSAAAPAAAATATAAVRTATPQQRLQQLSDFAARVSAAMESPSASAYLASRVLADSSTFALRLYRALDREDFRSSPFLPVPEHDVACYYGVPPYASPSGYDPDSEPVRITSDAVQGALSQDVIYEGSVEIVQADRRLQADRVTFDDAGGVLRAEGDIAFHDPQYTVVTRQPVTYSVESGVAEIGAADFQLNGSVLRGQVGGAVRDERQHRTTLQEVMFTTCPLSSRAWQVTADSVVIDDHEPFGRARGVMVELGEVPVLYLPYMQFPVTSERQSGLLYPRALYSSSRGFDLALPLYVNLAPNYDLTLTPRIMTKRSVSLDTELRFMPTANSYGQLDFSYIPSDEEWARTVEDSRRWMLGIDAHSHFLERDLLVDIAYQRVRPGDYDFLSDYGAESTRVTDNYLLQSLRGAYRRHSFEVSAEVRRYQQLLPDHAVTAHPFAMMPQLRATAFDSHEQLSYSMSVEATRFETDHTADASTFSAVRLHAEPELTYQLLSYRGTSLAASLRGFLTNYSQDASGMPEYFQEEFHISSLATHHTRALYLLSVNGKTTLERPVLDLRHTQTFEPQFSYQYLPYEDQSRIGLYDTTDRMTDYYSIFSHRGFTGRDRIADLNRVTVGFSTRLLDPHDHELLNLSVGQAYHFVPTRVTMYPDEALNDYPRSPLAMLLNASLLENVTVHAGLTYTNETNDVTSWNAMAEYRERSGLLAHVSYRFTRDGNRSLQNQVIDLSQFGVHLTLPLDQHVKAVCAFYRDLEQHHNIDYKLALRYEECCYAIGVVYENYSKTNWVTLSRTDENVVGVEIEFKGLLEVRASGANAPDSPDTYLISYFNPANLSR